MGNGLMIEDLSCSFGRRQKLDNNETEEIEIFYGLVPYELNQSAISIVLKRNLNLEPQTGYRWRLCHKFKSSPEIYFDDKLPGFHGVFEYHQLIEIIPKVLVEKERAKMTNDEKKIENTTAPYQDELLIEDTKIEIELKLTCYECDNCISQEKIKLHQIIHSFYHSYQVQDLVEVLDYFTNKQGEEKKKWRRCIILAITPYFIKVHFLKWNPSFDTWIHTIQQKDRLAVIGTNCPDNLDLEKTSNSSSSLLLRHSKSQIWKANGIKMLNTAVSLDYFEIKVESNKILKLKLKQVIGDGSCAFRALAQALNGGRLTSEEEDEKARELRIQAVSLLKEHKKTLMETCQTVEVAVLEEKHDVRNFDEYLWKMSRPNYFAGQIELWLLAEKFNVRIEIYASYCNRTYVSVLCSRVKDKCCYLRYYDRNEASHYDCLLLDEQR